MAKTIKFLLALLVSSNLIFAATSEAQVTDFPTRTVTLLVGFEAGGGTDTIARVIAKTLSKTWGHEVIVDNRPGAGGAIASELLTSADPDGYTINMTVTNLTVMPALRAVNYDPVTSFASVIYLGYQPAVFVINPDQVPANSMSELIDLAKSRPGELNYGASGKESVPFLLMERLKQLADIDVVNVNYSGSSKAMLGLLSGEVQLMVGAPASALEHIKAGKLKALAVSAGARIPQLPDVPTVAEATGFEGFEAGTWYGILAPADTPAEIVQKINNDVATAVRSPELQAQLAEMGFIVEPGTPEGFGEFIAKETAAWASLLEGQAEAN